MTDAHAPGEPLSWRHDVAGLPGNGLKSRREATLDERTRLAAALGVLALDHLVVDYSLKPLGQGRVGLEGSLAARYRQACVITLEPIEQALEETFDIEFRPASGDRPERSDDTDDDLPILSGADVEPLPGNAVDVGRVAFEILSAGIDPYPRKEGAAFDWSDPKEAEDRDMGGAFAALSRLKRTE